MSWFVKFPRRAGLLVLLIICLNPGSAFADGQASVPATPNAVTIPHLSSAPKFAQFVGMNDDQIATTGMAKVEGFVQERPKDGEPASQKTEAFLGYDDKNLYIAFLCFDSEPDKVRARMTRRETAFSDDFVEVTLDTFHDQQRGYVFASNPVGVQADGLWNEAGNGPDFSFDTVWDSQAQVTDKGYVVWMAIPFKSLRFSAAELQTWGITLLRVIPRANEWSYWPRVSSRIQGRLNQAGTLTGMEKISPGRNIQLNPYGFFTSSRALDTVDANAPRLVTKPAAFDAGLDAKFVVKDSLVLDIAINPDFSQVESDEPQPTINQRFEVFFPEKRPFFLENASYFQTPINLLFTRRIADPQFGARLTGKLGKYNIGALVADDEAPGKRVAAHDPLAGKGALFTVARISRDLFKQSSLGVMFTDREYQNSYNRVGGIDGRFKIGQNWTTAFQAVSSETRFLDGTKQGGAAYTASLDYTARKLGYTLQYTDYAKGFNTQAGFFVRPDVRAVDSFFRYDFRPEGKHLISWGPRLIMNQTWDHDGTKLNETYVPILQFDLARQTGFSFYYAPESEYLRPSDFDLLKATREYHRQNKGINIRSSYFAKVNVRGEYRWGQRINFVPAPNQPPSLEDRVTANLTVTLRPITPLVIDNVYLLEKLRSRATGANIYNNHIIRSKWNLQFNREFSFRMILQYDAVLANQEYTSLQTTKHINADFLLTYLVHPGTAFYAGYNSNHQNLDSQLRHNEFGLVRTRGSFLNDGRQFFVKVSYLFRL
ncbi:MAG: carbohydrate binding family 9 domain-containing protein [Acidobacteria bacterium]|nr:carbohydrate binding family 9 domain-containing protein [Acidobacteriota bacterium]